MSWEQASSRAASLTEVDRTGSTNADLRARLADGEAMDHLTVLLTRDQRAGRGRLDRAWTTPPGSALAVSVLVRVPGVPMSERGWIPLAAGIAMTEAIRSQVSTEVGVKWPNDVLAVDATGHEKKVCGILAEGTSDPDAVIIGAGINTAVRAEDLPVPTATSLLLLGTESDDDRLVAEYLDHLAALLGDLAAAPGDPSDSMVLQRSLALSRTVGREVRVTLPAGDALVGLAEGIDEEGRLVVHGSDGRHHLAAGDVIHVR